MSSLTEMDYFIGDHIAYNIMVKPAGAKCNLNCTYCYYLEKKNLYKDSNVSSMQESVLERFIKQYIQSQTAPVISFVWQGGEPMLAGLKFFQAAVEYQKYYAAGRRIINSFQTNGTLINEKWCKFFKQHDFLIGISIDGPEEIHDYYRRYKHGANSWQKVMKGLKLLQEYKIEFNTLTVINNYNAKYPLEVYSFLKSTGSKYHQYIPIVEQKATSNSQYPLSLVPPGYKGKSGITEWSVIPEEFGSFYIKIFDQWVKNDVGKVFVQMFDVILANWVNEPCGLCVFDKTCGNAAVIEYNGDLYSCDHFVYPENLVGNILNKPLLEMM
ncbi:MAG: anaerobic sulfatase maturase, partial [Bacteroidales bacterium]